MLPSLFVLTLCFSAFIGYSQLQSIKVHPSEHWYLDDSGRSRIFHGINSVQKGFPWYPKQLLNATVLDYLRDWGMNIVRLGIMWAGTEPVEGQYNETYLHIVEYIVDELANRGIYTLLDMHQDVLSSKFPGHYDGVPRWLVDNFPPSPHSFPWPLNRTESWEEGYLTQAVSRAFQHIYNNTYNALDKWGAFWHKIAGRFEDNPYVIGYEFMNEPWVGDYIDDPDIILPGNAGKYNLMPSYDHLNDYIRPVDNKKLVFYEPITFGHLFNNDSVYGNGFERVPGGDNFRNRSVYSFHYYCWFSDTLPPGTPDAERNKSARYCETEFAPSIFVTQQKEIERLGGASMLTEFGLCSNEGTDLRYKCSTILDLCDKWLVSWNYWDTSDGRWFDGKGNPRYNQITPFVRTYVYAVQGKPTSIVFNEESLEFTLKYILNPEVRAPTEIFVPKLRYPDGFSVTVSANVFYVIEPSRDLVFVHAIRESHISSNLAFVNILPTKIGT